MRRTASGRSLGTAEAEDARGAGPVRVGRCERSESQRAHVVSRRCIVEEVVRFVRARPRSRVSVARSRCAQGKRRPSVARVGGVTVGRVEWHLGRVALKRSCPSAHGRARRRTSRFEHAWPPTKTRRRIFTALQDFYYIMERDAGLHCLGGNICSFGNQPLDNKCRTVQLWFKRF